MLSYLRFLLRSTYNSYISEEIYPFLGITDENQMFNYVEQHITLCYNGFDRATLVKGTPSIYINMAGQAKFFFETIRKHGTSDSSPNSYSLISR